MMIHGTVIGGVVVLDDASTLPEGARVRVEVEEVFKYPHPLAPYDRAQEVALLRSRLVGMDSGLPAITLDVAMTQIAAELHIRHVKPGSVISEAVRIHPGAYSDILQITACNVHPGPTTAASAACSLTQIESDLGQLTTGPGQSTRADEADDLGIDLRMVMQGHHPHVYRVLFTLTPHAVNVLRVRAVNQCGLAPSDL